MFRSGKILGCNVIDDNFSTARLGCTYSTKIFFYSHFVDKIVSSVLETTVTNSLEPDKNASLHYQDLN